MLALFGTAWLLAPRGWPHRWAGLAAWTPLLTTLPSAPQAGQFVVTAFDVGQGTALLIETQRHRLLYDTGPQYAPGANGASRVILPYLRGRGIDRLDAMLVSHSDLDHAGGAEAVLKAMPVDQVLSSLSASHPVVRSSKAHTRCHAGQRWEWDGVYFDILGPEPASYADPKLKANGKSCVLRIEANGRAILLAADIEAPQEAALLRSVPERLRADVLLAPHHGSGTSSTIGFLQAVRPGTGIFQVGYRNRYRHPKREVYARYGALGIERLRTDESGAITMRFGRNIQTSQFRREHARYWHDRNE
jgi:competence protein ComEC